MSEMHEDLDIAKGELHRHFTKSEHHHHTKGNKMDSIASLAAGAALGGNRDHGWGTGIGGAVGGFLGAALGRNGGIFGNNNDGGGGVNTANLVETFGVLNAINTLGTQTQAGFNDVTTGTLQQTISVQKAIDDQSLAAQQAFSNVKDSIQTLGTGLAVSLGNINQNVLVTAAQTAAAITTDGDRTRALITAQYEATLNRQLSDANARVIALELDGRTRSGHDALSFKIENTNTAVAAQAQGQQQAQFQQIVGTLGAILPALNSLTQIAHATNSNVIVGNSGATTTGAQTASPTNVNAR